MNFKGRSIISIRDFNKDEINFIIEKTKEVKSGKWKKTLEGKIIASLFFEPSTRTRLSFETAIQKQGGKIIGFSSAGTSSTKKGESFSDSIKTVSKYSDIIIIRHKIEGAARKASEIVDIPIINAGDGANQHPTQTFLDLFTIVESKGKIDGLKIGLMGDLKYGRTIHSLVTALSNFDVEIYFISPQELKIPEEFKNILNTKKIKFYEGKDFMKFGKELDILYCTRIQKERFIDPLEYEKVAGSYRINRESLKYLNEETFIMHPLPRVDEISVDVDNDKRAIYFEQAENGVYTREALLGLVAGTIS